MGFAYDERGGIGGGVLEVVDGGGVELDNGYGLALEVATHLCGVV